MILKLHSSYDHICAKLNQVPAHPIFVSDLARGLTDSTWRKTSAGFTNSPSKFSFLFRKFRLQCRGPLSLPLSRPFSLDLRCSHQFLSRPFYLGSSFTSDYLYHTLFLLTVPFSHKLFQGRTLHHSGCCTLCRVISHSPLAVLGFTPHFSFKQHYTVNNSASTCTPHRDISLSLIARLAHIRHSGNPHYKLTAHSPSLMSSRLSNTH